MPNNDDFDFEDHTSAPNRLSEIVIEKKKNFIAEHGGIHELAKSLNSTTTEGLSLKSRENNQQKYGRNILPTKKAPSLFALMLQAWSDKILIILTFAAILSLSIGIWQDLSDPNESGHWIEGCAILVAVLIVILVNAINDYQREIQFQLLSQSNQDKTITLIIDGHPHPRSVFDLCVGDVACLEPGDVVCGDGVLIEGWNLLVDESSMTGESEAIHKSPEHDPFLISGSLVSDGTGRMLILAVGSNSFHGRMISLMHEESTPTPLQIKLDMLAERIAKYGLFIAMAMFVVLSALLIFKIIRSKDELPAVTAIVEQFLSILIQTVTIIVVAVPEGLPMAVSLSLAYACLRMLKDNNLVRVLSACETMGSASEILTDKTGTLTENKMSVVKGIVGGVEWPFAVPFSLSHGGGVDDKCADFRKILKNAILMNSTAYSECAHESREGSGANLGYQDSSFLPINDKSDDDDCTAGGLTGHLNENTQHRFIGNKTEISLLQFACDALSISPCTFSNVRTQKIVDQFPFSSLQKSMITVCEIADGDGESVRIFLKGASEIVLDVCTHFFDLDSGRVEVLGDGVYGQGFSISKFKKLINQWASQSLRTISVAFKDVKKVEYSPGIRPTMESFTLLSIFGIKDPLKKGVDHSVKVCQDAGITVRMVTGDNAITATSIGTDCGILMPGGVVLEGPKFRSLNDDELDSILPRLQVLARASPVDKQKLVKYLRGKGEVVAVTGDGTNDGPALKSANVGLSMGIAGTDVAKEASSIVLLDDNFKSIVKAVAWGRLVNDNVRKFLQFQLTVNISAVGIAFVSAVWDDEGKSILGSVQLLWINLIMDTFAALALATDRPKRRRSNSGDGVDDDASEGENDFDELLVGREPEAADAPLITGSMWKMIGSQALLQISIILTLVIFFPDSPFSTRTFIFNAFVALQLGNELNCRTLKDSPKALFLSLLRVYENMIFVVIWICTLFVQIGLVFFGGKPFSTVPMSIDLIVESLLIGLLSIPVAFIIKSLPSLKMDSGQTSSRRRMRMSRERLLWLDAFARIRRGNRVFSAIRRAPKRTSLQ